MKTYLTQNEIELIEKAATNERDRLLIRTLSRLGCRVTELIGIKVQNIDFENKTITIKHLKTRTKLHCPECNSRLGKAHAFCPGCGCKVTIEAPLKK